MCVTFHSINPHSVPSIHSMSMDPQFSLLQKVLFGSRNFRVYYLGVKNVEWVLKIEIIIINGFKKIEY